MRLALGELLIGDYFVRSRASVRRRSRFWKHFAICARARAAFRRPAFSQDALRWPDDATSLHHD